MSILFDRIRSGLGVTSSGDTVPTDIGPDLAIKGRLMGPTEQPMVRIQIYPGIITYEDMQATPLITADGAPIVATAPGQWGQLWAAGRS
jgi:hypothetical protein